MSRARRIPSRIMPCRKALGGDEELKKFRSKLNKLGLKLILDFVPNHLGLDHPWVNAQLELFRAKPAAGGGNIAVKTAVGGLGREWRTHTSGVDGCGAIDYRRVATRTAMREAVALIAAKCDGVRCDMAMLLLNEVFAKTWAHLPADGPESAGEFWAGCHQGGGQAQPDFIFMAEVSLGLEGRLQSLGFDYTYDRRSTMISSNIIVCRGAAKNCSPIRRTT